MIPPPPHRKKKKQRKAADLTNRWRHKRVFCAPALDCWPEGNCPGYSVFHRCPYHHHTRHLKERCNNIISGERLFFDIRQNILERLRAELLNAVHFRRGLTCTIGLANDLIDGGQPRVIKFETWFGFALRRRGLACGWPPSIQALLNPRVHVRLRLK